MTKLYDGAHSNMSLWTAAGVTLEGRRSKYCPRRCKSDALIVNQRLNHSGDEGLLRRKAREDELDGGGILGVKLKPLKMAGAHKKRQGCYPTVVFFDIASDFKALPHRIYFKIFALDRSSHVPHTRFGKKTPCPQNFGSVRA